MAGAALAPLEDPSRSRYRRGMPTIDLDADELAAVIAALREKMAMAAYAVDRGILGKRVRIPLIDPPTNNVVRMQRGYP